MIELKNVTKKYGSKEVISDLNIHFEVGNCYAIIGKNGEGKTTLLRMILDLIKPDNGKILFEGDVNKTLDKDLKRRIGCVLGKDLLIPELTGFQYLKLLGKLHNIPDKFFNDEIKKLLNRLFPDKTSLSKVIEHYSEGMKQSLAICASLINTPDILIYDEPFSNLDPVQVDKVGIFLQEYKNNNRLIIFSSHNMEYSSKLADRILILKSGKLLNLENSSSNRIANEYQNLTSSIIKNLEQ